MSHTIKLTNEQFKALNRGEAVTIEPPKKETRIWAPYSSQYFYYALPAGGTSGTRCPSAPHFANNFNAFETEELAKKASKRMRISNALISAVLAVDPDFNVFNCNPGQPSFFASYNKVAKIWEFGETYYSRVIAGVSTIEKAQQMIAILNVLDLFAYHEGESK